MKQIDIAYLSPIKCYELVVHTDAGERRTMHIRAGLEMETLIAALEAAHYSGGVDPWRHRVILDAGTGPDLGASHTRRYPTVEDVEGRR